MKQRGWDEVSHLGMSSSWPDLSKERQFGHTALQIPQLDTDHSRNPRETNINSHWDVPGC